MSLEGEYDSNNIFAKMLRGEIPCTKVFEDDDTLVFMDLFPQSEGHCLVIPKHSTARNLLELPPERLQGLFARVQTVAAAVVKALAPDGVVVNQYNGSASGQTVYHLHVHVIPRWENKPMGAHAGKQADAEELKALAAKISAAMPD